MQQAERPTARHCLSAVLAAASGRKPVNDTPSGQNYVRSWRGDPTGGGVEGPQRAAVRYLSPRESKKDFLKKRVLQDSFLFEGFHSWPQRSEDLFFGKSRFTSRNGKCGA